MGIELFALFRRFWPYIMAAVIAVLMCGYYYRLGVSTTDTAWQSKWNKQAEVLAKAKANAEVLAREEEQRRQAEMNKVTQDAEKQIARAEYDATAADAAAHSLREQAKRLAARASQCAGNSSAPQRGEAAPSPSVVLSDVLGRADQRAGELAAAYDRARASGLACERAYESLSSVRSGK
ncbi:DUF2514 domain-containing protein [Aeromonas hydrophila]|uniref:DUF2514 domain-containing protein n=1 Tax=Aeromonas hydrophila TaxID=644 RepID=UPI0023612685|nr:DUF2514 domain-containing protein [Aeromonas hydrophila]